MLFSHLSAATRRALPALLLAASLTGHAQELTLRGVPGPTPVVPLEGQGYYVLYRSEAGEDGRDLYAMWILDPELKVRYEYVLPLPVGTYQPQLLPARNTFGLAFSTSRGMSLHTFNPSTGAHLMLEAGSAPDRQRQPTSQPYVVGTPAEGYCFVQAYASRDTTGYRISVYDAALQPKWTRLYFPTSPRHQQLSRVVVTRDMIAGVLTDSYRVKAGTREERTQTDQYVVGFDAASGKELFRKPLPGTALPALQPHLLTGLTDGRVAITGTAFATRSMRSDSTLGLFLTIYRPDGSNTPPALTTWPELSQRLGNPELEKLLREGRLRPTVHELYSPTGTDVRIVAECPSGSNAPAQFMVLQYDASGQRTALYPITRSLRAPDPGSRYLGLAGRQSPEPYLLYSGQEPGASFVYATTLNETASRTAVRGAILLDKLPEAAPPPKQMPADPISGALSAFSRQVKAVDANLNRATQGEPVETYRYDGGLGFASTGPRQTVVYRYEAAHKQLRLFVQPLQ